MTLQEWGVWGINDDWQWTIPLFGFMEFPFAADQTQEFAIDLRGINGATTQDGKTVKLGEHTRVVVEFEYHHGVSGFFDCTDDDGYCKSVSKCDPDLGIHKFKVFNQDVPRNLGMKVSFDADDD